MEKICRICGGIASEAHHIISRAYCKNDNRVIVSLCHDCHMKIHSGEIKILPYLDENLIRHLNKNYPNHIRYL